MKRSVLGERKHRLISVANILHSSNLGNVDISDTESWRSVVEGYFCNDSDDADGELSDLSDCDDLEFDVISEDKENQPPNDQIPRLTPMPTMGTSLLIQRKKAKQLIIRYLKFDLILSNSNTVILIDL